MVDFSKFMVGGNRFQALSEDRIPQVKMPVKTCVLMPVPVAGWLVWWKAGIGY